VDTLRLGLEGAIKKGYSPTIAGLADMADAFNAIRDPVKQTAYLFDTFGKSGARIGDLMRLGGAGIRAAALDVQASGAVITGSLEAQALKMDDVVDKWERYSLALKLFVGGGVVSAIGTVVDLKTSSDRLTKSLEMHEREVRQTSKTYAEYQAEMVRAYGAVGVVFDDQNRMFSSVYYIAERNFILSEKQYEATRASIEVEDRWSLAIERASAQQAGYAANTAVANYWTNIAGEGMRRHEESANGAVDAFRNLVQVQEDLKNVQEDWQQGVGQKQVDLLGQYLPEGSKRYTDGLKANDEVMGTNLYQTYMYTKAQKDLAYQYGIGAINVDQYTAGLQTLKDTQMPDSTPQFEAATKAAKELFDQIMEFEKIDGLTVTGVFSVSGLLPTGSTGPGSSVQSGSITGATDYGVDVPKAGGQFGLNVRVPPGFPNDSWGPFYASSNEVVSISTLGQQQGKGVGGAMKVTFYGPVTVMPGSHLAAEIMKATRL
jgi:hypothetical protein